MTSPIIVGLIPITIAPINTKRSTIRFQNAGISAINIKKIPISGVFTDVSLVDFEIQLFPSATVVESGEAFETDSVASFRVISNIPGGILAIYETNKY